MTVEQVADYCTLQTNVDPWNPPAPGGGGPDPDENIVCYTLERDYYYYYPATDYWEYVWTDYYTWCEEVV